MGVVALAGGVGAAKLLRGLVRVVPPDELTIIGNVGDDVEIYGLHISPDLDIIMYTLAGIVDEWRGWGVTGDTFNCLETLAKLGFETWFKIGDRDMAVHIARTKMLRDGLRLSQVTSHLCRMLGVKARLIPATDDLLRTKIQSGDRTLDFQDYFVKRRTADNVTGVFFEGADKAEAAPGVLEAIRSADRVIICPSNPVLSIWPILSIKSIRRELEAFKRPIVGVSPIVGGKALKGPADRVMASLGFEASAYGVAKFYHGLLTHFVIDSVDWECKERIEELGVRVTATNTLMKSLEDSVRLAKTVMEAA
ncbi:MAG: 2-phospho-L-lactate transferase [Candidatus Bathyarchaeota archaeon]|nr:2-phospho-L-lactate transferase [Candidatus Bathyarchaeota archaeon]